MTSDGLYRRVFIAAAALVPLSPQARAQGQPALIARRLLFAPPERTWVSVSPDGSKIAFLAPVNGVQNVWLAPLDDPGAARPLTRVDDRDVAQVLVWPQDNRHVLFFREQGGDENWQAHRVDIETGDIRPLSPAPGVRSYVQQTSAKFPGEVLLAHNGRDRRYFDVHRVNVGTGESTLLFQNERFGWAFTDPDFGVRYGALYRADGGFDLLQATGPDAGKLFRRVEAADTATTRPIEVSDDGRLVWLDSAGRDRAALTAQDLSTGESRVIAEDTMADLGRPILDHITTRPLAVPVVHASRRWLAVDPAIENDLARLQAAGEGELVAFGLSNDHRHWIGYTEPAASPGRYLHYARDTGEVRRLFLSRPALEGAPLVGTKPVIVKARDGLDLVCYLTRPMGDSSLPGPIVLLVHGGPWARDMPGFNTTHQWLANRGYAVLSVNYRGSTGFGKAFVNAGDREWAGKMHLDLIDAVDWAIREGVADPARVAIYGASYGGYSALVGATFTPERFACAIDLFGISNLVTFSNDIPPYWRSWASVWKTRVGDADTEEGRHFLESRSPITFVDRIVRPLLIGQGGNDVRVTQKESEQIVAALQQRNIPVTYVFYKDEGHGFYRAQNRLSWTAVVEAFLAQHLGGRVEPVGRDFDGSSIEFRAGRELLRQLG